MGTGTAVAKPSPRCIAETEDGRGRAAEGNSDVTCTRGGQVQPGKIRDATSRSNLILIRVIALCPRCIGPVTVYSWFISNGLARIRRADCVMTEPAEKSPSRVVGRAPRHYHRTQTHTHASAPHLRWPPSFPRTSRPRLVPPRAPPAPCGRPGIWNVTTGTRAKERQHRGDPRPVRKPPLTSSVLPPAPQRAALRATKAIAPSRAAFVAKPQVRHGSRDPTEPNLEPASTGF